MTRGVGDGQDERRRGRFLGTSPIPPLLGIGAVVAGFILLALTWAGIADQGDVARQLPYLVSGGFVGLALVMMGLLVLNIATRRQDALEAERRLESMTTALDDLQSALDRLENG